MASNCTSGAPEVSPTTNWQLGETLDDISQRLETLEELARKPQADTNRLNLLVFEGHRDRLLAAFVMATGAAACGMEVSMFFTFWGTAALRKPDVRAKNKSLIERAFGWMLPRSAAHTKLSHLDMGGLGRALLGREMQRKNVADLNQLIETAAELNVTIYVCEMSMNLMGIHSEELIDYPDLKFCGVANFVDQAANANTTLLF